MAQDFQSVMSQLWGRLKLGAPAFGPSHSLTLSIDGLDVRLDESADGRHVIVSGVAGKLAPDAFRREQQVRNLLKTNLGMLQSSKAGLSLESSDERATVRIEAAYPYAANQIELLTRLIEDVLYRLELHTAELTAERERRQAGAPVMSATEETFIFRP
jgi:hypothetical protein